MSTLFGLPEEVRFCRRCVLSNQRPLTRSEYTQSADSPLQTIAWDAEDICSACRVREEKDRISWTAREGALIELLDQHRGNGTTADVLVPGSGGKDSIYAAYVLKERYGMTPITVTWAPTLYTDWGRRNQLRWAARMPNLLCTPPQELHRAITRVAFRKLLHPFQAFTIGQKVFARRMARVLGLPLVMYGESEAEYGGKPVSASQSPLRSDPVLPTSDPYLGGRLYADWRRGWSAAELSWYLPDPQPWAGTIHQLGYYHRWVPQAAYYYAVKTVGFECAPERTPGTYSKYNSLDDKMDDLYYYTRYIKFGMGRATADAAQEIRSGHLTREEGVALVHLYDGEFPQRFFPELLDYLRLTEEAFWSTIDRFRSPHLWAREGDTWRLRHQVQ